MSDIKDYSIQVVLDNNGNQSYQIIGLDDSNRKIILKEDVEIPNHIASVKKEKDSDGVFTKNTIGAFLIGFLLGGTVVYALKGNNNSVQPQTNYGASDNNAINELEHKNRMLQKQLAENSEYYGVRTEYPTMPMTEAERRSNMIRAYSNFDAGLNLYGKENLFGYY